jgi:hypothetical protein
MPIEKFVMVIVVIKLMFSDRTECIQKQPISPNNAP